MNVAPRTFLQVPAPDDSRSDRHSGPALRLLLQSRLHGHGHLPARPAHRQPGWLLPGVSARRSTKEMGQPCPVYLHAISLVRDCTGSAVPDFPLSSECLQCVSSCRPHVSSLRVQRLAAVAAAPLLSGPTGATHPTYPRRGNNQMTCTNGRFTPMITCAAAVRPQGKGLRKLSCSRTVPF